MSLSAAIVAELVAAGLKGDALVAACARIEAAAPAAHDEAAERRRAADRARKAAKREEERLRKSAESAEVRGHLRTELPTARELDNAPTHAEPEPKKLHTPTTSEADASSVEPPAAQALPIAKPNPRGSRILDNWWPPPVVVSWCRTEFRLTDQQISEAVDEFRDYWTGVPGQRGCKADWDGTFRNAVRRAYRSIGGPRDAPASRYGPQGGSRFAGYQRAAARFSDAEAVSRERSGLFDH